MLYQSFNELCEIAMLLYHRLLAQFFLRSESGSYNVMDEQGAFFLHYFCSLISGSKTRLCSEVLLIDESWIEIFFLKKII